MGIFKTLTESIVPIKIISQPEEISNIKKTRFDIVLLESKNSTLSLNLVREIV